MSHDSGPGFARFSANDTPADIERKMRNAFAPLRAMREGMARAFEPTHRWRDPHTGKFVKRSHD